jgi:hypothetical protein
MQGTLTTRPKARPQRRRWLIYLLRALWFAVAILAVEVLLVSIRPGYEMLTTICVEEPCMSAQLTPTGLEALTALGWSVQGYAFFDIALTFGLALIYGTMAIVIFRAQPDEPMALYVSLVLLLFGAFLTEFVEAAATVSPWLEALIRILPATGFIAFAVLFYLFPDGRFVPRWTRWAALAWVAAPFVIIPFNLYDETFLGPLVLVALLVILISSCVIAPIYRYRRVSNPVERQQTKWVMFGLLEVLLIALVLAGEILPWLVPAANVSGTLPDLVKSLVEFVSLAILPVTLALAMLHYRLWDVDLLLNRTLVYVPLTSILTVIYTAAISFSETFFSDVAGGSTPAVAIFTTIILTTTFTPLKNSLQTLVDRYFKEPSDRLKGLKELEKQLYQVTELLDRGAVARRLVEQSKFACNAKGAALYLREAGQMRLAYITPGWAVREGVERLPLEVEGMVLGQLVVGARLDEREHTPEERTALQTTAARIVHGLYQVAQWQEARAERAVTD